MTKKRKSEQRRPAKPPDGNAAQYEQSLKETLSAERYSLCLYITGTTRRSALAISNIRALCEEFLPGRYDLEVIDIYQQPVKTMNEQVIAVPTLIKRFPKPVKRLVGDCSDRTKLMVALGLPPMTVTDASTSIQP